MKTYVNVLAVALMLLVSIPLVNAQPTETKTTQIAPTLADTINAVLSNIQEKNSPWNVIYDQIFCRQNTTIYDNTITKALNNKDYKEVLFIARLAELNNYSSQTITNSVKTTLENMPMTGSFPVTYNGTDFPNSFIVYDRYIINSYRYAQTLNITRWNITTAYTDFTKAYNTPPSGSVSGEMLWINPQQNTARSFSSRYYDEYAETLSMFLHFALNGVPSATTYAEDAWEKTQKLWNGKFYVYTSRTPNVECEVGNFAQIITQYQNTQGSIPYFDRVISDLENKLLTNQYGSPGWGRVGVIRHAESNNQLRLYETLGNLIALQMLYAEFSEGNQTNFQNMLPQGWQGLINSSLFSNNKFSFMDVRVGVAGSYNDEASLLGAMALFLYGMVPQSGSLVIPASEERFHDYRTCFQTSQWQFNYAAHSIRVPLTKGNLTFIFGSQPVAQNFPETAVYDIQFSNDWNSITSISTANAITPPLPTPPPVATPTPAPAPVVTPAPAPVVTPAPAPVVTPPPAPPPVVTPTQVSSVPIPTPVLPSPSLPVKSTPDYSVEPSITATLTDDGAARGAPFMPYLAAGLVALVALFLVGILRYLRGHPK
ncbi:MAG: hypothetical protein LBI79_11150 [Nitrososphaerota archaeon]|jgi:hypothetical protein|nr:hypothetical protein [Nitrososphaerota archaeon]